MAIDFPSSPTVGQQYTYGGVTYTYTAQGVWTVAGASGNVSNSGTPAANDVAQWVTSTTIKGVPLATWRTSAAFLGTTTFRNTAGGDGINIVGFANQGQVLAAGASADIGLFFSAKGNASISMYVGNFASVCAQFNAAPSSNTFPTFTGNVGFSALTNNPASNPLYLDSAKNNIKGRVDGSAAPTSYVGEYIEAVGTSFAITPSTPTSLISMAIPAGDWDIDGAASFIATAGGSCYVSLSLITNALETAIHGRIISSYLGPGFDSYSSVPRVRYSFSTTTTLYVTGYCTAAGCNAKGSIHARRVS